MTIERRRPHIRSAEVEALLAQATNVVGTGEIVAQTFTEGELPFGQITDEDGNTVELLPGNLDRFLRSPDRSVRKAAWQAAADAHLRVQNTLAVALEGGSQAERLLCEGARLRVGVGCRPRRRRDSDRSLRQPARHGLEEPPGLASLLPHPAQAARPAGGRLPGMGYRRPDRDRPRSSRSSRASI